MRRRRGFTLIELLVVIAIIAILAAMLFPVFARARESARKIQCLANVKNIAMATQMYLADYDRMAPKEHRQEVHDFFDLAPGGNAYWEGDCWKLADNANPYLRWSVILDEYIRNRDVWQCPSAKLIAGPYVIVSGPDWFGNVVANQALWGDGKLLCIKENVFPPGWGGSVTDSFKQEKAPTEWLTREGGPGNFWFGISFNGVNQKRELKLSQVEDAASFIVVSDGGNWLETMSLGLMAYPDLCNLECANCWCSSWFDDSGCYSSMMSGCPECISVHARGGSDPSINFLMNPELRKPFARHLGGTNIGYMDGHAAWVPAEALINQHKEDTKGECNYSNKMGVCRWGPSSACGFYPAIY